VYLVEPEVAEVAPARAPRKRAPKSVRSDAASARLGDVDAVRRAGDLDRALRAAPVRIAVLTELETEAKWLRLALAEYADGDDLPQDESRRVREFDEPFIALVEDGLARRDREMLDRGEACATGVANGCRRRPGDSPRGVT
jgi:hypothetical protein